LDICEEDPGNSIYGRKKLKKRNPSTVKKEYVT
jgi:hypothetical protein